MGGSGRRRRIVVAARLGAVWLGVVLLQGAAPAEKPASDRKFPQTPATGGNPLNGHLPRSVPLPRLRIPLPRPVPLPGNIRLPKVVSKLPSSPQLGGSSGRASGRPAGPVPQPRKMPTQNRRRRGRNFLRYQVGEQTAGSAEAPAAPAPAARGIARPSREVRARFVVLPRTSPEPEPDRSRRRVTVSHAGPYDAAYYVRQGQEAFAAGDYRRAGGHFLNAGFAGGSDFCSDAYYAQCRLAAKDFRTAGMIVYRAVGRRPAVAAMPIDLRSLYADRARFDTHVAALKRAVDEQPDAFLRVFLLAYQYHCSDRRALAVKLFRRAAVLRPGDPAVTAFLTPPDGPPGKMVWTPPEVSPSATPET